MVKGGLAGLVVMLVLCPSALAATRTDPASDPGPWQDWVALAQTHVPTPNATILVEVGGDDEGTFEAGGPTGPFTITIQRADRTRMHQVFAHELGHAYDEIAMPNWARGRYKWMLGHPDWAWRQIDPPPRTLSPFERFAESYRLCARPADARREYVRGIGDRREQHVCDLIRETTR